MIFMKLGSIALGTVLLAASPTFASDKDSEVPGSKAHQALNMPINNSAASSVTNYTPDVLNRPANNNSVLNNNLSAFPRGLGNILMNFPAIPERVSTNQINNIQTTVSNVNFINNLTGPVTNTSVSVVGNSVTAVAVGNIAVTIIRR
jgi:hypothetical protein